MKKGSYDDFANKCGIYVITNQINGKQYVGQSHNIKHRWQDHRSKSMHPHKPDEYRKELYCDMRQYGLDNFEIKILELCQPEALKEREIYWINQLQSYPNGYNKSPGGDLPCEAYMHVEEDHGMAELTLEEVKQCRRYYQQGKRCKDIYLKDFYNRGITYSGFSAMWHGRTWKNVMPEVFTTNPHPAKKVTKADIIDIRNRFDNGQGCRSIAYDYEGMLGYTTIYGIAHRQTYQDLLHYKSDVSTISQESSEAIDTPCETGSLS